MARVSFGTRGEGIVSRFSRTRMEKTADQMGPERTEITRPTPGTPEWWEQQQEPLMPLQETMEKDPWEMPDIPQAKGPEKTVAPSAKIPEGPKAGPERTEITRPTPGTPEWWEQERKPGRAQLNQGTTSESEKGSTGQVGQDGEDLEELGKGKGKEKKSKPGPAYRE